MDHFNVSQHESSLHIEGFPDAVKVIALEGPRAKRLADLALHKNDLEFADSCLDAINLAPEEPSVFREALWRSAIVHFMKCFGDSGARFQLLATKVLKGAPPEAFMAFEYFKQLRNKHFVHDENSYAQSLPGAILNSGMKTYKIEKIVAFAAFALTLGQDNYGNLKLLIHRSRSWIAAEFDDLCDSLTAELERESYETLLQKESLTLRAPTGDEIHNNRYAPQVKR